MELSFMLVLLASFVFLTVSGWEIRSKEWCISVTLTSDDCKRLIVTDPLSSEFSKMGQCNNDTGTMYGAHDVCIKSYETVCLTLFWCEEDFFRNVEINPAVTETITVPSQASREKEAPGADESFSNTDKPISNTASDGTPSPDNTTAIITGSIAGVVVVIVVIVLVVKRGKLRKKMCRTQRGRHEVILMVDTQPPGPRHDPDEV